MGEYGRERVEHHLSWDHSLGNLLAAYERLFFKMGRAHRDSPGEADVNSSISPKSDNEESVAVQIGSDQ